jgi:hypothetical protein
MPENPIPLDLSGQAGNLLAVKLDESGYEHVVPSSGGGGVSLGETSSTAYRGDRGKTAYDHSQSAHAPSGATVNSTDATLLNCDNHTTGTTNKLYTATEKTKLAGIATGATANDTDANLKARVNHTGTQLASTISDFNSAALAAAPAETGASIRSALGTTTVGAAINTLVNPSAISFVRVNADNTVTARTPAQVLSDIGAQAAGTYLTSANIVDAITDAVTDKAPSQNAVFDALLLKAPLISPSFTTPALGTPASGTLTNCTFPTLNQNTSGTAANLSGTPALPNGTTATTQAALDNSTKLCTTAYTDTGLALKANLVSPSFTTPAIGAATGASLAVSGALTSSGGWIGYTTGSGGTVTQLTSRVTTVVLNRLCGNITMFSSAVLAAASSQFTFTNSFIAVGDIVLITHNSTTNACSWVCETIAGAGSATVVVKNISAASITEATPLKFIVIKAVSA